MLRVSSGSSQPDRSVKSTRSANTTVTSLRCSPSRLVAQHGAALAAAGPGRCRRPRRRAPRAAPRARRWRVRAPRGRRPPVPLDAVRRRHQENRRTRTGSAREWLTAKVCPGPARRRPQSALNVWQGSTARGADDAGRGDGDVDVVDPVGVGVERGCGRGSSWARALGRPAPGHGRGSATRCTSSAGRTASGSPTCSPAGPTSRTVGSSGGGFAEGSGLVMGSTTVRVARVGATFRAVSLPTLRPEPRARRRRGDVRADRRRPHRRCPCRAGCPGRRSSSGRRPRCGPRWR